MNTIPRTITFTIFGSYTDTQNRIEVIKTLRMLCGFGLKEAKDLSEDPGTYTFPVVVQGILDPVTGKIESADMRFRKAVSVLEAGGVVVHAYVVRVDALNAIRKHVSEAMQAKDYEFAQAMVDLLRRFD